jgi:hypothetical protein
MNAPSLRATIKALPEDIRERLESIPQAGRGAFRNATTQQIADKNLDVLTVCRSTIRSYCRTVEG